MTENNPEQPTHQDPAEPKETGTETETGNQPDPGTPVDAQPVTVEPNAAPVQTNSIHGKDYTVTEDAGYRLQR